jgi:hypothetical protein
MLTTQRGKRRLQGTFPASVRTYVSKYGSHGAEIEPAVDENSGGFMDGNFVGLAAVVMIFGIPMAAMYTFFRVRKLRSEERLAAIARGVDVPMQPELSEAARSRRSGILLVAGALGYIVTFVLIGRVEPDAMIAATFGGIPLAIGLGYFVDHALIERDARAH